MIKPAYANNGGRSVTGEWWLLHRSGMIRALIAVFLWSAVLSSLFVSIRTLNITEGVAERISAGAQTPEQAAREMKVCEAARVFIIDYLSFYGDNKDYASRMESYGEFKVPVGEQTVTYAGVESINGFEDCWRLVLNVHLTRYISADEKDSRVPLDRIVRQYTINGRSMAVYREEIRETYELSVCEEEHGIKILGTPVLISNTERQGRALEEMVADDEYPADFAIFIKQVIPMYYRGDNLANFTDNNSEIMAARGYSAENIRIVRFEEDNNNAKAIVSVDLTDRSTTVNQQLVIEARRAEGCWLLTRIGGF